MTTLRISGHRLRCVLAVAMVVLTCGWGTAFGQAAEDTKAQAKALFKAGSQAYQSGRFLQAAQALEEAYRLSPFPQIAFSIAQAYRKQYFVDRDPPKLKRALQLYRAYLAEVSREGRRGDALQHVADLEPILARVEAEQRRQGLGPIGQVQKRVANTQLMVSSETQGAMVSLNGSEPAEAPLIREVKPGQHRVLIFAKGYFPEERSAVAVDGRLIAVEVTLRPKPALVTVKGLDDAGVLVDGRRVATLPVAEPIRVEAGRHFLAVTKRGHYPFAREITAARGQDIVVKTVLQETTQRKASKIVLGAAGVSLLGGLTFGALGLLQQSKANDIRDKQQMQAIDVDEAADYRRFRSRRNDLFGASYLLYGTAAVLGTTGVLLYYVDTPRAESSSTSVEPVVTPDQAGLRVTGRF